MKRSTMLIVWVLALLTGCAAIESANRPPVLGAVENGVYTHPNRAFRCSLPTSRQGFAGGVEITDAARIVETVQRVIPVDERRPGDPPLREEIVYPVKYKPRAVVTFEDTGAEKTMLEIGFRRLRADESREAVFTSGYGGGNYGVLFEGMRRREGREYGAAVAQLPYWRKGEGYMGADLWASFLNGAEPAPSLDVIFNLVEGDAHYWFLLRNSALEFIPETVNPKDLEAVFQAFEGDRQVSATMENRLWSIVKDCAFGGVQTSAPAKQEG